MVNVKLFFRAISYDKYESYPIKKASAGDNNANFQEYKYPADTAHISAQVKFHKLNMTQQQRKISKYVRGMRLFGFIS